MRIAEAAGVPWWFVVAGWEGAVEIDDLLEAWSEDRLEALVKDRWAGFLRQRIVEHDPALENMLRILVAIDSLNPRESAAVRELLRYLGRGINAGEEPELREALRESIADTGRFSASDAGPGSPGSSQPARDAAED